ncbi:MFS transporter [Burkholderia sp. Tr-20390]|uniref:MFS transporter n=1 Tax=Burkholderia sp. Tr-20390 TaxID=2703904 RepID=UPI001981CB10|nr:MFS transporter [Burkholderia sp. Tr-20390]MBN3732987.1 MFS transporter [Burkholderia sp. Tr-20390]
MLHSAPNLKWRVLIGYFLSYMFDAVDIIILAIAMPAIRASLQIGPAQAGMLVTATLLGVGISGLVMGPVADRWGRRSVLLLSLGSFGLLTMAIAAATDWREVLVLRFLSGLGLGSVWSLAASHVNETWPTDQRARATSFVLSSFSIGAVVASAAAAYVIPTHGWRVLFFVCGAAVSIAMAYVWLRVPESEAWKAKQQHKGSGPNHPGNGSGVASLFAPGLLRVTLLGTLTSALALAAYWGASTWLPTFLVKERGLEMGTMARFLALLNVGMFIGYNVFGYIADRIGKKKALLVSLICTGLLLPFYVQATDRTVLLLLGPVFAFFMAFAGLMGSYFAELFPTQVRATGTGFCFNVGRGFSAFAPLLLGSMSSAFGFGPSIAVCGGVFVVAAVAVLMLPTGEALSAEEAVTAH